VPFVTGTDRLSSFLRTFKLQVPDNRPAKKSAPIEKSFSAKRFFILSQTIFHSQPNEFQFCGILRNDIPTRLLTLAKTERKADFFYGKEG